MILLLSEGGCKVEIVCFFFILPDNIAPSFPNKNTILLLFPLFVQTSTKNPFLSLYFSPDQVKFWPVDLVAFFMIPLSPPPLLPLNH